MNQSDLLLKGIEEYKRGNYEVAIDILQKERQQHPKSSNAAFFSGLAYKQVLDYPKAAENLRDAVTLTPRIKDALVELIDVLNRMGEAEDLEEAHKWIAAAEEEKIAPAKTAFLKGLVLQKQGKNLEAVKSFENAVALDESLAQSAEVQMAVSYIKERDLKMARERFRAAVTHDPQSDLAGFARRYLDTVEKRIFEERPLRFTLGVFGQYDSNVVLKPVDSVAATGITDEETYALLSNFRVDYVPVIKGPWLFHARYSAAGTFHKEHSTSHDYISNGFYAAPGYNFGNCALNLAFNYNHTLLRDPNYKQYVDIFSTGPLFRIFVRQNHLLEFFVGYDIKEYNQAILIPEEDRDAEGLRAYTSWIWFLKKGAFFNARYEFSQANADGVWWDSDGNTFSFNTVYPLREKLKLQLSGQAFLQDYNNYHSVFNTKRDDETYTGSVGITWECCKKMNWVVQYSKIRGYSNIAIYDYKRDIFTTGIEFKF